MPGMSFMTDAVKTPKVPMPGMSFMNPQSGGTFYTTKHMSMEPAGGMSARDQSAITSDALPAQSTKFPWNLPQPWPISQADASWPGERAGIRQRSAFVAALFSWTYRAWLICATMILTLALFELQSALGQVQRSLSIWRIAVQWAELSWLAPVPLALILWLGWLLFAEAVRGNPAPIGVLPARHRALSHRDYY